MMLQITVDLSPSNLDVITRAHWMHSAVPFHKTAKRQLSRREAAMAEETVERLRALRDSLREQNRWSPDEKERTLSLTFSQHQIILMVEIIENVLAETLNNDYDLVLHVTDRDTVEDCLANLRRYLRLGAPGDTNSEPHC